MSEILEEQQWQRKRAAKLQRANQPRVRPTAAQKPVAAAKPKVSAKKLKTEADSAHVETAPSARPHAQQPSTPKVAPQTAPAPRHEVERVSLIDKKKPRKKAEDGEVGTKRDVLPPISRIRASLDRAVAPPKPPAPVKTEPAPPSSPEAPGAIADSTTEQPSAVPPLAEGEAEEQKVILIKPPIIVKQLASELEFEAASAHRGADGLQYFRQRQSDNRTRHRCQDRGNTTGLFSKKSAVKKAPEFTKSNRSSSRLRRRLLKRKRNSSPARPSSRSWGMSITARRR